MDRRIVWPQLCSAEDLTYLLLSHMVGLYVAGKAIRRMENVLPDHSYGERKH